jgi:hypothetical protein
MLTKSTARLTALPFTFRPFASKFTPVSQKAASRAQASPVHPHQEFGAADVNRQ